MRKLALLFTLLTVAVFSLSTAPAQAQAPRTFVSAAGSDSNPCSFALPCRHFQAAVNVTSDGGEVDALDPGGYSPITISRGITIEGQGWSYIAPPTSGAAITINAVNGNVAIRGVSLNGVGVSGITDGIIFNSGGSLTITDCVVQNFSASGIFIGPSSGTISFAITNTIVASNGNFGITYSLPNGSTAAATGVIDHVVESNSLDGLDFVLTATSSVNVAVSNSIFNGNARTGITLAANGSSAFGVSIDNTHTTNNNTGIDAIGAVTVLLSRSVISFNNVGVSNQTSPNLFFSYQDNRIDGNNNDISSPLNNSRTLR